MGRPTGRVAVLMFAAATACGCRLTPAPSAVPCPLPLGEQQQAVEKLVSAGSPRDETLRRLEAAGLTGRFGSTESIYYLDTWTRPGGDEWLMEVAVLFDDGGRYLRTRPADPGAVPTPEGARAASGGTDRPRTPFAEAE